MRSERGHVSVSAHTFARIKRRAEETGQSIAALVEKAIATLPDAPSAPTAAALHCTGCKRTTVHHRAGEAGGFVRWKCDYCDRHKLTEAGEVP